MEYQYPPFAGTSKTITMRLPTGVYYATIRPTMKEGDEIYAALRGALVGKIGSLFNIIM